MRQYGTAFLILVGIVSVPARAGVWSCTVEGMMGSYLLFVKDRIENADSAALFGFGDFIVPGTIPEINGATSIRHRSGKAYFSFTNTAAVDWESINPADTCYVVRENEDISDFSVEGSEYVGTIQSSTRVLIHPKRPSCPHPQPVTYEPKKIICKAAKPIIP